MRLLLLLISVELVFIVSGDTKHFYIENNRNKCALFDLSSDIDVIYSTKFGSNTTNLNMAQAVDNQIGMCDNGTNAIFNITINPKLDAFLNFNFINSNQLVSLTSIQFGCTLTNNSYFPDAIESGYISKSLFTNISLSKATNFYQCKSKIKIHLSENVTVNIYFAKLKVFNVLNNSFGDGMDECSEDFNLTTVSTSKTTSSTLTSETKTTEKTSTYVTTKSSLSTSHASTSHIPTSHTSTSHIPTSHNSTFPSTTLNHSTKTSSTKFSTHISSTISSTAISTTVKPDQVFLYGVKSNKIVCLLMESVIEAKITYNKNKLKILTFSNSSFTGHCSDNNDTITITSVPDVNLTLIFSKKEGNSVLTEIRLTYLDQNMIINEDKTLNNCTVGLSKGYFCKNLNFSLINSTILFQKFHYEAFRTSSSVEFQAEPTNCESSTVPNSIVAIVVGVVLAAFLVIIVVVFLIFRYRASKRRNYEEI